jgi:23S rRNA (cytidine1920-2'-O)/16S rRNA (cytidine1409-2'-O)-methyltransferase
LKERIDLLLVELGYFQSRERAKASIMAGIVFVDGLRCDKPGTSVPKDSIILVKENLCPYVSRGGLKLEKAINSFGIDLTDKICIDIGASTGGFTDCMLQNGAKKVYCIDVGKGQLDWKLRNDPRITNMEKVNIRYLDFDLIIDKIDFISIDVSFISLKLVLPIAKRLLSESGQIVCLVKPQFEAGREQVGNGIIKDPEIQIDVLKRVVNYAETNSLVAANLTFSPMTGAKGNIEFLLHLQNVNEIDIAKGNNINIENIVKEAHIELGGTR